MKKIILILSSAILLGAGAIVFTTGIGSNSLSELILANVEALADTETVDPGTSTGCKCPDCHTDYSCCIHYSDPAGGSCTYTPHSC